MDSLAARNFLGYPPHLPQLRELSTDCTANLFRRQCACGSLRSSTHSSGRNGAGSSDGGTVHQKAVREPPVGRRPHCESKGPSCGNGLGRWVVHLDDGSWISGSRGTRRERPNIPPLPDRAPLGLFVPPPALQNIEATAISSHHHHHHYSSGGSGGANSAPRDDEVIDNVDVVPRETLCSTAEAQPSDRCSDHAQMISFPWLTIAMHSHPDRQPARRVCTPRETHNNTGTRETRNDPPNHAEHALGVYTPPPRAMD